MNVKTLSTRRIGWRPEIWLVSLMNQNHDSVAVLRNCLWRTRPSLTADSVCDRRSEKEKWLGNKTFSLKQYQTVIATILRCFCLLSVLLGFPLSLHLRCFRSIFRLQYASESYPTQKFEFIIFSELGVFVGLVEMEWILKVVCGCITSNRYIRIEPRYQTTSAKCTM